MEILADEDLCISDACVWDMLPLSGSNWRLVKKNLVKRDFDNKKTVRNFFNPADKIVLFSTPSNPRYGLYLYIADVMKDKDVIFFHFVDETSDLPAKSFLKGVNILIDHDSRDELIETVFAKDAYEYLEEMLNKIMHERIPFWLGGVGAKISQQELGKAIRNANKQLNFPRCVLVFLFGYPPEELVMPLCERGIATVQRIPVDTGKILALQGGVIS